MRTRQEVTDEKLRGGFYSPDALVDVCFQRIAELTRGRSELRMLEPSAGDGAFIAGLARHVRLARRLEKITAIELVVAEAAKCRSAISECGIPGDSIAASAIAWAGDSTDLYDVAVGNPPFVRFQFVSDADKRATRKLELRLGISFAGVSNLWLPLLVGALSRLQLGGAFAFIIPAESFTGISAGELRRWLVMNCEDLRVDLFPPDSFPSVLQEVIVLSGSRTSSSESAVECEFHEHKGSRLVSVSRHSIPSSKRPWTRYLLSRSQLDAFEAASKLPEVWAMEAVAKFEVAAVTGANDYFAVDDEVLRAFDLAKWSVPLLPRIRHARGLRYMAVDHEAAAASGAKTHLLDFSAEKPDPELSERTLRYLDLGEEQGLPKRYKCRIRSPWYRVPFIRRAPLMLSKRSHFHPKVVLNEVGVVTTDTIYRGRMRGFFEGRECDFVAAFHNSLTLLSAEVEGRSFGGGVLELVPSEVSKLLVPMPDGFGGELDRLDGIARGQVGKGELLIDETDLLLVKAEGGLSPDLLEELRAGRLNLMQRRIDRTAIG